MPRFALDPMDLLLTLLRRELPDATTVMSRIPDGILDYLPLVVLRRTGGDSVAPDFWDQPLVNVQAWCRPTAEQPDANRAAADLADQVRGVLWRAWREQTVIPGLGHLVHLRESSAPLELGDSDLPLLGRYTATYDLRVRPNP